MLDVNVLFEQGALHAWPFKTTRAGRPKDNISTMYMYTHTCTCTCTCMYSVHVRFVYSSAIASSQLEVNASFIYYTHSFHNY